MPVEPGKIRNVAVVGHRSTGKTSLAHLEWQGRKINLIDTPGDPGFQGDMIAAIRVVEGALVVVSAVMGVEVQTSRAWQRAGENDLSRVVVVNMLDRER